MNVLAPLTTQPPSTRSARVRMAATSEPVSGSVIASAAIFSPRIAGASQRSRCASVPNVASGGVAIPTCAPMPADSPPEPARGELLAQHRVGHPVGVGPVLQPEPAALGQLREHLVRERARRLPLRRVRPQLALHERPHLHPQRLVRLGERRDRPHSRLRSIPNTPRMTSRWICLPWRELRKSPMPPPAGAARWRLAAPASAAGRAPSGPRLGRRQRLRRLEPLGEDLARAAVVEPLAVARVQRRRLRRAVDVGRRAHARRRRRQPRVHDRRRDAAVRQHGHRRLADPHLRQQLAEVVEVGLGIGRDRRLQRLRVVGRERAQRVLDARAELAQHLGRQVLRVLGDEEDADALGADQPHGLGDRVEERVGGVVEQQVRLVEEEHELRLVEVAGLRQLLEQLGQQPHQRGREQLRLVLHARQLEARDHAAPVLRRPQQVGDRELRLAEELVPAALLEPDQRAQQHADRRARQPADALQLRLALVGVEEGQQRAQVGEVDQRQPLLVGVVEDEPEALLLRLVRAEDLGQQLRPEVRHRRAHRHAGADPAEREVLGREARRRERQAELRLALLRRLAGLARHRHAGQVALDVGREHRHARRADSASASSCSVRVLPVPVAPATSPWRFIIASGIRTAASWCSSPLEHAAAELDRRPVGRVAVGDRLRRSPP